MSAYIVMTASAKMPASVKAPYRKVAVCLVSDPANPPKMISPRARGMLAIVSVEDKLNVGKGIRSAYAIALEKAKRGAETLNYQHAINARHFD